MIAKIPLKRWWQSLDPLSNQGAKAKPQRSMTVALCTLVFPAVVVAQAMTMTELAVTVAQHNPGLQAAQRNRETANAAIKSAAARSNPRVDFGLGHNNARLVGGQGGLVSAVGISQLIENPDMRTARIAVADFGAQASAKHIDVVTNELTAQVRLRAFEYLLRQEEANAATEALGLLEQIRNRVNVRVQSGEAARYELIKADAEVINARQKMQTTALQVEQAALMLNRLAAGMLPKNWSLRESLNEPIVLASLADIQASAAQNNPEVTTQQAQVLRREAALREVQASRWPGIDLRVGHTRDAEVRQTMVSLSVPIPLLDKRTGPVEEAVSQLTLAQEALAGRRAELEQQVLLAWKALQIAKTRVEALSSGAVREAEAALRVAQAAYQYGERGILDVLDAQRLLRIVRADLLDARFQVQAAAIDLDALAGRYTSTSTPAATKSSTQH